MADKTPQAAAGQKLFSALSLARKAGALAAGFDAVESALLTGTAQLVLLAADVSPRTGGKITDRAQGIPVRALPFTQQQIADITRKPVGVMAVTNKDLATLCQNSFTQMEQAGVNKEEPV